MERSSEPEHVVVSGVSRGLGLAIATDLLERGYAVSGFSRGPGDAAAGLMDRFPERFYFQAADVSDAGAVRGFVELARQRLGRIYGLVNNAATVQPGILATLPEVTIEMMLAVNLYGPIRLARICVRDMMAIGSGRIINISSVVGARGYNGLTVYSATKAGLDGFTRGLAREAGRRNITVNSIAPGYMRTDMSAGLSERQLDQIERRTPLGRLAEISDIVPLARFLLSPDAAFITGQTILVDGGVSN